MSEPPVPSRLFDLDSASARFSWVRKLTSKRAMAEYARLERERMGKTWAQPRVDVLRTWLVESGRKFPTRSSTVWATWASSASGPRGPQPQPPRQP